MTIAAAQPIIRHVDISFSTLGRHRSAGVGLALTVEAAILAVLAYADPSSVVGLPAAVAAAIGGSVAVVFGPWDGAAVAFGGAIVFGVVGGWEAGELAAVAIWPAIVVPVGYVGRRVAEQRLALHQLVIAQERERQQLALELHDETAQSLAAALMTLARVETAESDEQAIALRAQVREMLQETLARVRGLAVDLRPKALDDFGLRAAAERLAVSFTERTGVPVEVELEGHHRLPAEVELALFRVLQEALRDVAERADATRVRVGLTRTPAGVRFEVADDGLAVRVADGHAFASARERLRLVGGRLSVSTPPGAGTTVRAVVPT